MIRLVAAIWLMLVGGACAGEAIIDGETGRLVAGVDAHKPRFPASTTKLMTIFVALEAAEQGEVDLEARVHVSKHAASAPPVKLGLKAGEDIRLGDAIHAALILSSNDAARVIAEAISGTEHAFAARMTAKAHALEMHDTDFSNASGLPDTGHVSTAADIARLIWLLDKKHGATLRPLFRKPLAWKGGARLPRNGAVASVDGAWLGKTGFTCAAGYTAAVIFETAKGKRAVATMANSGRHLRALSLSRLAKGRVAAHEFTPPCGGAGPATAPNAKPRLASLGEWSLTLGVFSGKGDALAALKASQTIVPSADRVVAIRENGNGFYAMVLAGNHTEAQQMRARLIGGGLRANLIDQSGRRALKLQVLTGL